MDITDIIMLLGGVAMFLFGMSVMGDGLQKSSGNKLEPILYKMTSTMPRGVLLGTLVTAVIQSSSATSVMVVGFVNSGMMKVRQGISVILGAILGTSITGWVICLSYIDGAEGIAKIFSTATLTGIVALVGIILKMFAKSVTTKNVGDIFLGFALLMFGMSTMSGAVSDLGKEEWFTTTMTSMSNPFLGILVGLVFTALLQSASAAVGIIQALSVTGALTFESAWPLLSGVIVGAALPVVLSSMGATAKGKRTAFVYPICTTFGVILLTAAFYISNAFIHYSFLSMIMNPFSLALTNTIMRFVLVILVLPFTNLIEKFVTTVFKDSEEEDDRSPQTRLEDRFIDHPALAIEQSRMTINDMALSAQKAVEKAISLIRNYDDKSFKKVKKLEDQVDNYEDALGTYLIKLTGQELNKTQNEAVSIFLHTVPEFESISDIAMNIAIKAREMHDNKYQFSEAANHELDAICAAVLEIVKMTNEAFVDNDISLAKRVAPLEEYIDYMRDTIKQNHVTRLKNEICSLSQGIVFNDIITNCERVSDLCSNIAVAMIEIGSDESFETHEYLNTVRERQGQKFEKRYENYNERFPL
jgi:phosphate:Na+ symporter